MGKDLSVPKPVKVFIRPTDTVAALKAKIEAQEGIPSGQQCVVVVGVELEDGDILEERGIFGGSSTPVHLVLQPHEVEIPGHEASGGAGESEREPEGLLGGSEFIVADEDGTAEGEVMPEGTEVVSGSQELHRAK